MSAYIIKSYAKINLSLNVVGKSKNRLHKIESIVTFLKLSDKIKIKKIKDKKNKVVFSGKFSKNIPKKKYSISFIRYFGKKKIYRKQKIPNQYYKEYPANVWHGRWFNECSFNFKIFY